MVNYTFTIRVGSEIVIRIITADRVVAFVKTLAETKLRYVKEEKPSLFIVSVMRSDGVEVRNSVLRTFYTNLKELQTPVSTPTPEPTPEVKPTKKTKSTKSAKLKKNVLDFNI